MLLKGATAALALWATTALAGGSPSASTKKACKKLEIALPDLVSYPLTLDYHTETKSYWSTALWELKPSCLVLPRSAEDVAAAVRVLRDFPDVEFAVKSGGHDPNPRHASVKGGVLISMKDLAGTTYDEDKRLAYVKPGGEWNDVIGALELHGVTVAGGRLGLVGVGGYLLQGGISFLSSQYGLAADSIVGWETITADGEIVYVDAEKDQELAVAMRGSGSQFGIVTQFTIKTHPIGKVWGGTRLYAENKADELYAALHEFVPANADDPKEAIIFTDVIAAGGLRIYLVFFFYDGPKPPTTGAFARFLEIDSTVSTTKTQSYAELLKTNGQSAELLNARVSFRTYTIPHIPSAPHMYTEITEKFASLLKKFLRNPLRATSQCSVDFQPFPSIIGKHSEAAGGNAMGISGDDPDRILLEIQCSWASRFDDDLVYEISEELTEWLEIKVPEWTRGQHEDLYLPFLMNDAAGSQNVTGTYKDYAKFKALQEKVDPDGFFRLRGGGYTY